jgi:alpha-tubulin suppressor-like RCC1 family protein
MSHMGAITSSNKLFLWGCNKYGQLGSPDIDNFSLIPSEEMNSKNYSEVACGLTHTLTLSKDGIVSAAGDNDEGQCGVGKTDDMIPEFEIVEGLRDHHVTKVIAGCHSAAITTEEHIYVWGTSTFGQFLAPERSSSIEKVIDASIGRSSGAAVDRSGKVWTWGYNELAQLGLVDTEPR